MVYLAAGASAATGTRLELHIGIDFEAYLKEIDFNGLRFFEQVFVDEILIPFNVEYRVVIFRFIQNQTQGRAASSALVQENPYGLDFFAFKVFRNLLCC